MGAPPCCSPPPNEKRADGSGRQARRIHRYSALALPRCRPAALKTAHHFSQNLGNNLLFHSQHEAKEGAVIGHCLEFQRSLLYITTDSTSTFSTVLDRF